MKGKLAVLQKSEKVSAEEGYKKLIAEPEKRNADLVQVSDDLYTVLVKQAPEAQEKLELLIATNWEADPNKATLRHPAGRQKRGSTSPTHRVSSLSHVCLKR